MIFKWNLPSRKLEDLKSSRSSVLCVGLLSGKLLFSKREGGRNFSHVCCLRPSRDGATTNHFAYENVPNLLTVNQVLHKDVRKFKLGSEHRLHITRVEQVATPRDYDSVTPRFVAMKGGGKVWYDIEVSNNKVTSGPVLMLRRALGFAYSPRLHVQAQPG